MYIVTEPTISLVSNIAASPKKMRDLNFFFYIIYSTPPGERVGTAAVRLSLAEALTRYGDPGTWRPGDPVGATLSMLPLPEEKGAGA